MEYFKLAFINLKRKKFKNFITVLSIAVGVISITVINVISSTGTVIIKNELDTLGINGISLSYNNSTEYLQNADLKTVREIPNVINATPVLLSQGMISAGVNNESGFFWGIDTNSEQTISIKLSSGRDFTPFDITSSNKVCILDEETAKNLFGRKNVVGGEIYLNINMKEFCFKIIGIAKADSSILQNAVGQYIPCVVYLPYTTLQKALYNEKLNQIAVKVNGNEQAVAQKIVNVLKNKNNTENITFDNLSSQRSKLNSTLSVITTVLTLIGGISLIVAGMGTLTAMISGVNERTKEIGIKKSIGAKKTDIAKEFLAESVMISFLGCVIGIAFAYALMLAASLVFDISLQIDGVIILKIAAVSIGIGLIFGVYPAVAAAQLNPADALNNEK